MDASKTVLCVDDESAVLFTLKALIEAAGLCVLTASSGAEAIRIVETTNIDLVIMDYWMPQMSGIAASKIMKQLKPDIRILFLSAYAEFPGETIGLADTWGRKGEQEPERFVARIRRLVNEPPYLSPMRTLRNRSIRMGKRRKKLKGKVVRVIKSPHPELPEKAEINIDDADELYKEIRVDNVVTDDRGENTRLEQGEPVNVVVETCPEPPASETTKQDEAKKRHT